MSNDESFPSKFMVESPDQIAYGIASGGYEADDFVNVANTTYRICAPTGSNKSCSSIILWTKSAKDDDKPEWSKVVSNYVNLYNVYYFNIFADRRICL